MSVENYRPSGDDILCLCKKEIAMASAKKVTVEEPSMQTTQPTVAGQKLVTLFSIYLLSSPFLLPVKMVLLLGEHL